LKSIAFRTNNDKQPKAKIIDKKNKLGFHSAPNNLTAFESIFSLSTALPFFDCPTPLISRAAFCVG
jgi:hypothetical protein